MAFNYSGTEEELETAGTREFKILPPKTEVILVISEATEKENASKNGDRVSLKVQVVDGEFKGVNIFEGFNINSRAGKNYKIDEAILGRICVITLGKQGYRNVSELQGKIIRGITGTTNGTGENADKIYNCITQWEPLKGSYADLKKGKPSQSPASSLSDDLDDDIPF